MEKRSFGFLIQTINRYGTEYVMARIVAREEGKDYPRNPTTEGEDNGLAFDGLRLDGFVSGGKREDVHFIAGNEPEYFDVHAVDLRLAKKHLKTLQKIQKKIDANRAHEPGDVFMAMAVALDLKFAVAVVGRSTGSSYSDDEWNFMTLPEGRDYYRRSIDILIHTARAAAAA